MSSVACVEFRELKWIEERAVSYLHGPSLPPSTAGANIG